MTNSYDTNQYDIVAKGLRKSFGNFEALRGVDISIKKGEFFTLFGPNGAGKTTFIKLLSTLAHPTEGSITVAGFDTHKEAHKVRGLLGVISHDPYLYENLSAFENIKFFGTMYGITELDERAGEVIKQVGLDTRKHDLVRTFSRGMKQRLAVARAIAHDPKILLLDEPYTGLDQHGAELFGEMLAWLKSHNRTILMTTHNIDEGLGLSDRVGILREGRIVYDATIDQVDGSSFKDLYISRVENS